jgi:hypothetical protein
VKVEKRFIMYTKWINLKIKVQIRETSISTDYNSAEFLYVKTPRTCGNNYDNDLLYLKYRNLQGLNYHKFVVIFLT